MEQLKTCYETYLAKAEEVWKDRPVWDGFLGLGESSKDHPCHMKFIQSVETWTEEFLKSNPTAQQAEEAVTYILEAAEPHKDKFPYWTLYAAHGLARPLIGFVSPQYAARMRVWYNAHYPRRERMPAHQELFKLLKKRERG